MPGARSRPVRTARAPCTPSRRTQHHRCEHRYGRARLLTLLLIAALQLVVLLARSEAWHVCVAAAGGTVPRRVLFRAAGLGYLASVLNGSVGLATRLAC